MTEQQWPDEARAAVVSALVEKDAVSGRNLTAGYWSQYADAVLAALAPHVVPRADQWGVHYGDWLPDVCADETHARLVADNDAEAVVVKRRAFVPAGPWEVASDA